MLRIFYGFNKNSNIYYELLRLKIYFIFVYLLSRVLHYHLEIKNLFKNFMTIDKKKLFNS
jgi:hypothetical protein